MTTITHHTARFLRPLLTGVLALLLVFPWQTVRAQTSASPTQVKAVFLFHFTKFVTWPQATLNGTPFVLGILGNDPFGAFIEQVVEGETVNGMPIVVKRYNHVSEIRNCHLLYVNQKNADEVVKALAGRNVLTVGDGEDFIRAGGIIGFSFVNNKIRLRINAKQARAADLQISSKLLRVADVIDP